MGLAHAKLVSNEWVEQFGLTMHFGLSRADLLKFRKSAWHRPIWIGLAQADLDRLILMNTLQDYDVG